MKKILISKNNDTRTLVIMDDNGSAEGFSESIPPEHFPDIPQDWQKVSESVETKNYSKSIQLDSSDIANTNIWEQIDEAIDNNENVVVTTGDYENLKNHAFENFDSFKQHIADIAPHIDQDNDGGFWGKLQQNLDDAVSEILIDDAELYQEALAHITQHNPKLSHLVEQYRGSQPLIEKYAPLFWDLHSDFQPQDFFSQNSDKMFNVYESSEDLPERLKPFLNTPETAPSVSAKKNTPPKRQRTSPIDTGAGIKREAIIFWLLLTVGIVALLLYFFSGNV